MGILPELGRAWISVDNRLYLWDYTNPVMYTLYNGLSDVIVSVALATPKAGIFTDIVKYVLVVATTVEVVLLAVTFRPSSDRNYLELKLQNTQYTISTDNTTIFKIVCSVKGRIFLAGNDRNLYELVYETSSESWREFIGFDEPHKCKKVSHSSWSLINILDPVFRVFGGVEDGLVDLAVDDLRGILYGVSSNGNLSIFHLGIDGCAAVSTASGFDVIRHVQDYLITRSSIGRSSGVVDPATLKVVSLHVVDPTECSGVHLVITMSSGARVYICVNTSYWKHVVSASDTPQTIQIIGIRNPPPVRKLNELNPFEEKHNRGSDGRRLGPDYSSLVCAAFYSHGLDVYALSQNRHSQDVIVGIGTDSIIRRSGHTTASEPLRSLTESLCVVDCNPCIKKVYDIRESCPQLSNPAISALRALYVCSSSLPGIGSSAGSSSTAAYQWNLSCEADEPSVPVGPPAALSRSDCAIKGVKCGISRGDIACGIVASLGEMAQQHGPGGAYPQRRIFCLGNSGLHTLAKLRPVDYLFRMLSRSSSSNYQSDFPVDYLADVGSFFEQYGVLNGCCMCFGLACGLPSDAGGDVKSLQDTTLSVSVGLSTLQRRAISAILRYSDSPSYTGGLGPNSEIQQSINRQNMLLSGVSHIVDPRVVPGASPVCHSACHNGLYMLTSRLLRPVWSKVLISTKVISRSEDGAERKDHFFILRRQELNIIMRPIIHLIRVLREYFGPVLASAEAAHVVSVAQALSTSIVKPTDAEPSSLVSKQLAMLRSVGKTLNGSSAALKQEAQPQESYELFAKKQEDASIFRCYRLLCRSVQALHLLDIMCTVGEEYGITVPWNIISGVSFCSLVILPSAQLQAKSMVQNVVSRISPGYADPLVALIDSNCYMYFSVGDRLAFDASKLLEKACDSISESDERSALISRGVHLLLQACLYWRSHESVGQGGGSNMLADFCAKLRSLGTMECFDGIVDLSLKTADNFKVDNSSRSKPDFAMAMEAGGLNRDLVSIISGDRSLYHGGGSPVRTDSDREIYRACCYETLLGCIRDLLSAEKDGLGAGIRQVLPSFSGSDVALSIVFRMVTRAAASSDDVQFHTKLYFCLLDENRDMLIRIDSRYIENFLLEQDPYLTYEYYTFHAMYVKAAQLMDVRAHIQEDDLHLDDRVQDLGRAVSSAQRAVAACREARTATNSAVEMLNELEEKLDIAELQRLVLTVLSSKLKLIGSAKDVHLSPDEIASLKSLEDVVLRLSDRLWSVSELYNQVTEPYELWDISLTILHTCKHDDPPLIRKLWTSIIYRAIPMRSEIPEIQQFFVEKRRQLQWHRVNFDEDGAVCFEDTPVNWLHDLQSAVVDLGGRLCRDGFAAMDEPGANGFSNGTRRNYSLPAFPLAFIVEELEEIASLLLAIVVRRFSDENIIFIERGWVAK